jgi:hypothetical protein
MRKSRGLFGLNRKNLKKNETHNFFALITLNFMDDSSPDFSPRARQTLVYKAKSSKSKITAEIDTKNEFSGNTAKKV